MHLTMHPTPNPLSLAVSAASYIVAPDAVTADELAAMALALIADAGLPAMEVSVSTSRNRNGGSYYALMAYDLDPVRNVFDTYTASGSARTSTEALAELSGSLSKWAALVGLQPGHGPATTSQKSSLIRLLNHPNIEKLEKNRVLVRLNRLTQAEAVALTADLQARTRVGWEPKQYQVVGEAFAVPAA